MTCNRSMRGLLAAALSAAAIPVSITGGTAAASVGERGGSATYDCQGDRGVNAARTPVKFALISPPRSVRPGDTVSLSGTLQITLSDADAQQSKLELATNANVVATDFALVVTAGDKTITAEPRAVTTAPEPIKDPWTMSADVAYSDITIPASATGRVSIRMPRGKTVQTAVAGTPEKVTFNAEVAQDSPVSGARNFACWAGKFDDAIIAQIPVAPRTGASSDPTESPGPTDDQVPDTGITGSAPPSAGSGPAALPDVPSAPAEAAAPSGAEASATGGTGDAAAAAGEATALADAPIPPETATSRTFIPGWILVVSIAIFPITAVAVAVLQRRRVKTLLSPTTTPA